MGQHCWSNRISPVDQLYSRNNGDFIVITADPVPGTFTMPLADPGLMRIVARRRARQA